MYVRSGTVKIKWRKAALKKSLSGKIVLLVLAVILTGTAILIGSNLYSAIISYEQVMQSYERSLDMFMSELNHEIDSAVDYMKMLIRTTDVQNYCFRADSDYFVSQRMADQISVTLLREKYLSGMWLYSDVTKKDMWIRNTDVGNYGQVVLLRKEFQDRNKLEKYISNSWNLTEINGEMYLVYVCYDELICYGAWCCVDNILKCANDVFSEGEFRARIGTGNLPERSGEKIRLVHSLNGVKDGYLELVSDISVWSKMNLILEILAVFSMICILVMLLLVRNMNRYLIKPVGEIMEIIQRIGEGNLDLKIDTVGYVEEFKEIGDRLNGMSSDLKNLKIAVYEEQLQKKNAQLQFQNSQIRPHFMLNVINSVYSMAGIGENGMIMKLCSYLAEYMRYVFSSKEMVCTLEEEISHLKEYLLIQEIRFGGEVKCELEINPFVMNSRIPTMAIHTFAENFFKYGMGGANGLHAGIKGELDYEKHLVRLIVWDNGPGFPEEIKNAINDGSYEKEEERKDVGIRNSIWRFRELYGDQFRITIKNEPDTEIILLFPYQKCDDKKQRKQNENTDC